MDMPTIDKDCMVVHSAVLSHFFPGSVLRGAIPSSLGDSVEAEDMVTPAVPVSFVCREASILLKVTKLQKQ